MAPMFPAATLPSNQSGWDDALGFVIDSNDVVTGYWADGKRSNGTQEDLDANWSGYWYLKPSGQAYDDIMGVALDRTDGDVVWTLYRDGSMSAGTVVALAAYEYLTP